MSNVATVSIDWRVNVKRTRATTRRSSSPRSQGQGKYEPNCTVCLAPEEGPLRLNSLGVSGARRKVL